MQKTKIAFGTLGCKLNQFESDSLISEFVKHDYKIVSFNEKADVYIINTCTVTNKSDAKSRNLIQRVNRLNSNALLLVTGCYAVTDSDAITKIPGVDYIIDNSKKYNLFKIVHKLLNQQPIALDKIKEDRFHYLPTQNTLRTRGFLKIQDGCNEKCSYCKIPVARGKAESRPYSDVIDSVKKLIDFGYKELVLTGINLGDYLFEKKDIGYLLQEILNLTGDFRIHLSSIEPMKIRDSLFNLLTHEKLCKHLHIPLQSGSDRILKLMKRNYDTDNFRNIIEQVRKKNHSINMTTDVMVGFPSESEEDFDQTLKLVIELGFTHLHTFKYSIRNGTEASLSQEHISGKIKSYRSLQTRELSEKLNIAYREQFINQPVRILIEKEIESGLYSGYSDHYIRTTFSDKNADIGHFRKVIIKTILENKTVGVID